MDNLSPLDCRHASIISGQDLCTDAVEDAHAGATISVRTGQGWTLRCEYAVTTRLIENEERAINVHKTCAQCRAICPLRPSLGQADVAKRHFIGVSMVEEFYTALKLGVTAA